MSASSTPTSSPSARERVGEVRRERRLADATLARRDRERHVWTATARSSSLGPPAAQSRDERRLLLGLITSKPSRTEVTPSTARRPSTPAPRTSSGAGSRRRSGRSSRRPRPVLDEDVANHVELGHRLPDLGVDDLLERLQDRVAVRLSWSEGTSEASRRERARAAASSGEPAAASRERVPRSSSAVARADRRRARPRGRARGGVAGRPRCRPPGSPSVSTPRPPVRPRGGKATAQATP